MERDGNRHVSGLPSARASIWSTFTPWLAGLCVGLVFGSIALGVTFGAGRPGEIVATALRYLLGGFLVLLPIALVVGLPLAHAIRARQRGRGEVALLVLGASLATGVVLGLIIGMLTAQILNSLLVTVAAAAWCVAFAIPLASWFQTRQRTALTVVLVTAAAAVAGGILVLAQWAS